MSQQQDFFHFANSTSPPAGHDESRLERGSGRTVKGDLLDSFKPAPSFSCVPFLGGRLSFWLTTKLGSTCAFSSSTKTGGSSRMPLQVLITDADADAYMCVYVYAHVR